MKNLNNISLWDKIYSDFGVKNQEELEQKLNKTTAERIFNNLENENINTKEINEIVCIGCLPYSEEKIKTVINEIQMGIYEFTQETTFNSTENYFLIYLINTISKNYILIEVNPYEMYDPRGILYFMSIEVKKKYIVPNQNIIYTRC